MSRRKRRYLAATPRDVIAACVVVECQRLADDYQPRVTHPSGWTCAQPTTQTLRSCIGTLLVVQVGGFELYEDLASSEWVTRRIHDFAVDVGSVIPEGFDAYVRLLHPAFRDEGGDHVLVSWSEIATANGRTVHPEMPE